MPRQTTSVLRTLLDSIQAIINQDGTQSALRYGENPDQSALLLAGTGEASLASQPILQGKAMSYNNWLDADAAWRLAFSLPSQGCAIIKHGTPCGVAIAADAEGAYRAAFASDPESAFGGIIAFNRPVDLAVATAIVKTQFAEVVLAPSIHPDAREAFQAKPSLRVIETPAPIAGAHEVRSAAGSVLVQSAMPLPLEGITHQVVSKRIPTDAELTDLLFAWSVVAMAKSNAIVLAKSGQTVGIGQGQTSRVFAVRIAGLKAADAGLETAGSVLASDAFFPFPDGIEAAAALNVHAVIQPGGSVRDDEVTAKADELGLAMIHTGRRVFRH